MDKKEVIYTRTREQYTAIKKGNLICDKMDDLGKGVQPFGISLGQTGRRVVLGHTLNTQTLTKTDEQKKKNFK